VTSTDAVALPRGSTRGAVAVGVAGKAAEGLTLVALLTVVPRLLGPADYGTFALALGLVTLGSASVALGGPTVMARFVAAAPPAEQAGLARALALRAVRWRAAGLALLASVVLVLVLVDPGRFRPLHTLIVLAALVLDAAATLTFQIALGLDRPVLWSFRYPLQNLILVAAVPPLHALAGTSGALLAIALSSGGTLALGAWAIGGRLSGGPSSAIPPAASRFALLQTLSGLLVQVLHRGGVVAVALLADSRVETGYAALAAGVAIALTYAVWQLFTVSLPRLAALAADDVRAAGALLTRLAGRVVIVLVPASVVAAVLAGPLLRLLAGGRFEPAEEALAPALATVPLAPLMGAVGAAAAIRLRPGARLWTTAVGAAVFVLTALALVPSFGAEGATAALLAGTVAAALAGTVVFPDLVDYRLVGAALAAAALVLGIGVVG
jgi:O-antigen/teichoic acid export membrane protein